MKVSVLFVCMGNICILNLSELNQYVIEVSKKIPKTQADSRL